MKTQICTDEKLNQDVGEISIDILKELVKRCPKVDGLKEEEILINLIVALYVNFVLNFTATTEHALKVTEFFFEAIRLNIKADPDNNKKTRMDR